MLWSVGLRNESDLGSLLERINAAGIPTQDISGLEEAQVQLRPGWHSRTKSLELVDQ